MKVVIIIPTRDGRIEENADVRALRDYARSRTYKFELKEEIYVPDDDGSREDLDGLG